MKRFLICVLFFLVGCGEVNNYLNTLALGNQSSIQSVKPSKDELTKIVANDKHVYYISDEEMSWEEAYKFCKRHGLQMADYMRTIYNENMTAILGENPICNIPEVSTHRNTLEKAISKRNPCNIFVGLTSSDTKVWIYPAQELGRVSVVINLKNGKMSIDITKPDIFGVEQYTPYKAMCEDK